MKDKFLIFIPNDANYIEILGHRIDGFESFEAFCEHLKKYAELEETVKTQQAEIERLKKGWKADVIETSNIKAEAVKEFAERLKREFTVVIGASDSFSTLREQLIDRVVKEMVGAESG